MAFNKKEPMQVPLYYDSERNLLICIICQCGISGSSIKIREHFTEVHSALPLEIRIKARAQFGNLGALLSTDIEGLFKAQSLGYHPKLKVWENKIGCGVPGCAYAADTRDTIVRHLRTYHNEMDVTKIQEGISAQQIFGFNKGQRYFQVEVPTFENINPSSFSTSAESTRQLYEQYQQHIRELLATMPDYSNRVELTLWDARTRWPQHFAGQNMRSLHQTTEIDSKSQDPTDWSSWLLPAVQEMIEWCHDGLGLASIHVRRLMRSIGAELSPRPLRRVEPKTLERYGLVWKRMMLFLFRVRHGLATTPYPLNSDTYSLLDDLEKVGRGNAPANVLRQHLLKIAGGLIQQPIQGDSFRSPIIRFIGILGYHVETGTWLSAHDYRPTIAQTKYLSRIIGLELSLPRDSRDQIQNATERVREYWQRHLWDGSDTMFTELHSQHAFAKTLSGDYYVHPSILWSLDSKSLRYKGEQIDLDLTRQWIHSLLTEAITLLQDKLIFVNPRTLTSYDPSSFVDNMIWKTVGDCICDIRGNKLCRTYQRVMKWSQHSLHGRVLYEIVQDKSGELLRQAKFKNAVNSYRRAMVTFQELLLLLVYFTSGLPARGTELTSLKWANASTSMRNIFIVRGRMVTITEYNKTDKVLEVPKIIVRFLPDAIGRLILIYIADILPFLTLLEIRECGKEWKQRLPDSHFLWAKDGKPWSTERVSMLMGRHTENTLGVRITLARWRDIAIAIDQKFLRRGSSDVSELTASSHVLQAGHSEEVEQHHYALSVNMLRGVSEETLTAFEEVSLGWHTFWGWTDSTHASAVVTETSSKLRARLEPEDLQEAIRRCVNDAVSTGISTLMEELGALKKEVSCKLAAVDLQQPTPRQQNSDDVILSEPLIVSRKRRLSNSSLDDKALKSGLRFSQTMGISKAKRDTETTSVNTVLSQANGEVDYASVVDDTLRIILGPGAAWRSDEQRRAMLMILQAQSDVIVRLPTAAGKSLLIILSAYLARDRVTIVVVPYLELRKDARRQYAEAGVPSLIYTCGDTAQASVVLVNIDTAGSKGFSSYMQNLIAAGQLVRIFVDECHVLVIDQAWRKGIAPAVNNLARVQVQRVCMSATMSDTVVSGLAEMLKMNETPRPYQMISQSLNRPQISYEVVRIEDEISWLQTQISRTKRSQMRTLIFVMEISEAVRLSAALEVDYYAATLEEEKKRAVVERFQVQTEGVLVSTTALSAGVDIPQIGLVVHFQGTYGLIDLIQQAGRGGRNKVLSRSVVLLNYSHRSAVYDSGARQNKCNLSRQIQIVLRQDRQGLRDFIETRECRRYILAKHFEAESDRRCTKDDQLCDNCIDTSQLSHFRGNDGRKENITDTMAEPDQDLQWVFEATRKSSVADIISLSSSSSTQDTENNTTATTTTSEIFSTVTKPCTNTIWLDNLEFRRLSCKLILEDISSFLLDLRSMSTESILRVAWKKARSLQPGCIFCWLTRRVEEGAHSWTQCGHLAARVNTSQITAFAKCVRQVRFPYRRHFSCFLPLSAPYHTGNFDFSRSCENGDLVKEVFLLALDLVDLRMLIQRLASITPGMTYEKMACALVTLIDGETHFYRIDRVFAGVVLFIWLKTESS